MTTLTIRIEQDLKDKAFLEAKKLGIPLTVIVKDALRNFVKNKKVTIGDSETVFVTPDIQKKMDKIGVLLSKINR